MRSARAASVAVLALMVVLAGCGGDEPAPAVTVTVTPSATPSATGEPADDEPDGKVVNRSGEDYAVFVTPSGNIACQLSNWTDEGGSATCLVDDKEWRIPERGDCDLDWQETVYVAGIETGTGACAGDPAVLREGNPYVLQYGDTMVLDGVRCTSEKAGVHCEDDESKAGFDVSRSRYELIGPIDSG